MTPPRDLGKNASRRPHRKSRLGCNNCKRRRVKCDEAHPICSYCRARGLPCQYPVKPASPHANHYNYKQPSSEADSTPGSAAGTPGGSSGVPDAYAPQPPAVTAPAAAVAGVHYGRGLPPLHSGSPNIDDLELLLNFTTSTANCLSPYNYVVDFWREEMPKLAFNWPFLLHGLFALSSMQLARFRRQGGRRSPEFYASQATYHWHQGLRMAGALLPQINEENCHALYVFAVVSCLFSLARGPRPGDFLMFGGNSDGSGTTGDGTADWCLLLRGVGPIGEAFWLNIQSGPVGPITVNVPRSLARIEAVSLATEPEPFRRLRELLRDVEADRPELAIYMDAVDHVSRCYSVVYDAEGVPCRDATNMVMIAMFTLADSKGFISLLQSRVPSALIIYAHFAALFKEVNLGWMSNGWAPHLMAGVYQALPPPFRIYISWPMKHVNWLPPE